VKIEDNQPVAFSRAAQEEGVTAIERDHERQKQQLHEKLGERFE
jgi:hypothetical protein